MKQKYTIENAERYGCIIKDIDITEAINKYIKDNNLKLTSSLSPNSPLPPSNKTEPINAFGTEPENAFGTMTSLIPNQFTKEKIDNPVNPKHYTNMKISPVEYIIANKMEFNLGNVIKYVSRHQNKNGKEDLLKAREYLDIAITNYDILFNDKI